MSRTNNDVGGGCLLLQHGRVTQRAVDEPDLGVLLGDELATLLIPDERRVLPLRVGPVQLVEGISTDVACSTRRSASLQSALDSEHRASQAVTPLRTGNPSAVYVLATQVVDICK